MASKFCSITKLSAVSFQHSAKPSCGTLCRQLKTINAVAHKKLKAECRPLFSPRRTLPLRGLRPALVGARGALAEAADVARGAVLRRGAGAHHLREQLHVVVGLTRHLLADRVQLFEESRFAVHRW